MLEWSWSLALRCPIMQPNQHFVLVSVTTWQLENCPKCFKCLKTQNYKSFQSQQHLYRISNSSSNWYCILWLKQMEISYLKMNILPWYSMLYPFTKWWMECCDGILALPVWLHDVSVRSVWGHKMISIWPCQDYLSETSQIHHMLMSWYDSFVRS